MARYALVIGISENIHPFKNLSKTKDDANAIADLLEQHGNFVSVDRLIGHVSHERLTTDLKTLLLEKAKHNEVVIYYTGHGFPVDGDFGEQQIYLAPSNCEVKLENKNIIRQEKGISLNDLNSLIGKANLSNLVVFLECCHSGYLLQNDKLRETMSAFSSTDYYLIAACREFEKSYALTNESHSIFTTALLKGLQAEKDDRGSVTTGRLFDRIYRELSGKAQEPFYLGSGRSLTVISYPVTADRAQHPEIDLSVDRFKGLKIAKQIYNWLNAVGYKFEFHEDLQSDYCEWIVRDSSDLSENRILIRGIRAGAESQDLDALAESVKAHQADLGFLIVNRRISPTVKSKCQKTDNLRCMTFDELIDRGANFDPYLEWLAAEVKRRGIDRKYVSLGCIKEEIDPKTQHSIATSNYGEAEGWIEGYIRQWLADDSKEHVSILGEFGTGKTWFAFHYAWECLQAYKKAKADGLERPRLPLLITLRDYNKALRVESVLSDLFFNKHDIRLNSSVFDCLNQMGKLLLIFDGFDEMADKVDKQKMINNFWELARVVVPGSKVILTSRTEHFPHDRESRQLLNAELESSTARLKWEAPRFELLELAKFNNDQIRQVLTLEAADKELNSEIVDRVMTDAELLDLARRPVMTELIIEAMPEIEAGKPIDMTRIYFYAITRKMSRDITAERTFTSMADKVYFLCELAWEMLSTERMKLNYRDFLSSDSRKLKHNEFDKPIKRIFPQLVEESKNLDHWEYDMRGQTILIRNAEGDYSPAHRSFLEFLVAYKFAAELGLLKTDFLFQEPEVKKLDYIDETAAPKLYTWNGYLQEYVAAKCEGRKISPLQGFRLESYEYLQDTFGREPLTKAVIDLIMPMLVLPNETEDVEHPLLSAIHFTKGKTEAETGWLGGNAATLLVKQFPGALSFEDLSYAQMANSDLLGADLQSIDFTGTNLTNSLFTSVLPSQVLAIAMSQDGKFFVTGHKDFNIRLWDVFTGQLLQTYPGHRATSIAISPDGKWFVSGSTDNTLKRWDVSTGECFHTYTGHQYFISAVAISADGKWFVSGSADKTLKRWDVSTGECLHTYTGHNYSVTAVAISADGKWFVSGSNDNTLKRWDVSTGECLHTYTGHQHFVSAVEIVSEGKWFVSGSNDNTLKRWDVSTGECLHTYTGHQHFVNAVEIVPDGKWLVSGSDDNTLKRWDVSTGECLHTYTGHDYSVTAVAIVPEGEWFVSGSNDNTLKRWQLATGKCLHTYTGYQKAQFTAMEILPGGEWFVSGSHDNTLKRWQLATGKCLHTYTGHEDLVTAVAISPDNTWLVSGSWDTNLKLWDVASSRCLRTYTGHQNSVCAIAIDPNGKWFVSGSKDKNLKLWDIASGQCLRTYTGHNNSVCAVAISPNGKLLVSGSADNTIKRWNMETGDCVLTSHTGHQNSVNTVAISPDDSWFVTGSDDGAIRYWLTMERESVSTYTGHHNSVCAVAISPNGTWLVSGSADNTIKRWEVATAKCLHTYTGHKDSVISVAISLDVRYIISCAGDEIKIWQVETGECIRTIFNKPCAGMQIAGAKGLTSGQIESLIALGAVNE